MTSVASTPSLLRGRRRATREQMVQQRDDLGVLGRQVGDTRLVGARPPSAVWRRAVL